MTNFWIFYGGLTCQEVIHATWRVDVWTSKAFVISQDPAYVILLLGLSQRLENCGGAKAVASSPSGDKLVLWVRTHI